MSAYEHLHDPQSIPLCLLCEQHEEYRDGLCAHCVSDGHAAEHNANLALLADRAQLTGDDVDRFVYDLPLENERESATARVIEALDYAAGGAR